MSRPRTQVLLLLAATLAGLLGLSAPASAAAYTVGGGPWNLRAAATTSSAVVGTVQNGPVEIDCQVIGQRVTIGRASTNIWDRVAGRGFVTDLAIRETPYGRRDPRLPDCGAQPAPAPAPSGGTHVNRTADVRDCVDTGLAGCAVRTQFAAGQRVTMTCWIDGSTVTTAYASPRWFWVTDGGRQGFVHSGVVAAQTTVPHCGGNPGVSIARWAAEHVGAQYATAAEYSAAGMYSNPDRRWSGWCAGFLSAAIKMGAQRTPRFAGNAKDRYYAYQRAGLVRTGPAPVGAELFWPGLSAYGHVAAQGANGTILSTMGFGSQPLAVARVGQGHFGTPAGWVAPWDV